jgi:hypothetical protein
MPADIVAHGPGPRPTSEHTSERLPPQHSALPGTSGISPDTSSAERALTMTDIRAVADWLRGAPVLDAARLESDAARRITARLAGVNGHGRAGALDGALEAELGPQDAEVIRKAILDVDPDAPIEAPIEASERPITVEDLRSLLSKTQWAWHPWLARGYLSLLVGRPGVGKSALALTLAGAVILGWTWPDGTKPTHTPTPVVYVDTEAAQAMLLERLDRFGIPTDKVLVPALDRNQPLADIRLDDDAGWAALERLVKEHKPLLVIVDSLRGAHGGDENSSDLADLMKKLAVMARDHNIAILALHHLRKTNQFEQSGEVSLDQVRGSTAIVAQARVVMAIDKPDPLLKDTLRLSVIKSNLSKTPDPIGFAIGEAGLAFGKAPKPPERVSEVDKGIAFLRDFLADGKKASNDIFDEGGQQHLSKQTINRAKTWLGIKPEKTATGWVWCLPSAEEDEHAAT